MGNYSAKSRINKALIVSIVTVFSLIVTFSLACFFVTRNDMSNGNQRQVANSSNSWGTTPYGSVGMTSEEYIAEHGYANDSNWVAIGDDDSLKNYIKNQNGKNGYLTTDITFDWNDSGAPYMAPKDSAILETGLTLDGCGFEVTNNSTTVGRNSGSGASGHTIYDNSGVEFYQEAIGASYSTNYYHRGHGTFINLCKGTIKNINYNLQSTHNFGTKLKNHQALGGLIGFVAEGATVDNVNVNFSSEAGLGTWYSYENVSWNSDTHVYVGGIAGVNMGTISNAEMSFQTGGYIYAGAQSGKDGWSARYVNSHVYVSGIAGKVHNGSITNAVCNIYTNDASKFALRTDSGNSSASVVECAGVIAGESYDSTISNVISNVPNGVANAFKYQGVDDNRRGYLVGMDRGTNNYSNYYVQRIDTDGIIGTGHNASKEGSVKDLKGDGLTAWFNASGKLVVSNADSSKIVWNDGTTDVYTQKASEYVVNTNIADNTTTTFTFGTTANVASLAYEAESVEFDGVRHNAHFYDASNNVLSLLDNSERLTYTSDNTIVGTHTAIYTADSTNIVGADTANRVLYLCADQLTDTLTITQRVINVTASIDNVYNSSITIGNLLEGATVSVGNDTTGNGQYNLTNAGTFTLAVPNNNYKFADGVETSITVAAKEITVDGRIGLVSAVDGVSIADGKLTISKKTDSLEMKAVSDKYGIVITEITGATISGNPTTTNGLYQATIVLNNDVTALGVTEQVKTVSATATATDGGTAEVSKANPTIGEQVTFTAVASSIEYVFLGWTENGKFVSFDAEFTTVVGSKGKALVANFSTNCNVTIMNGETVIANLDANTENLVVGDEISLENANLGEAATAAASGQAYNKLIGWVVESQENDGRFIIKPQYEKSLTSAEVTIDGEVKDYAVNDSITLTAGNYTVNGVAITVNEVTTLKAISGLTIVTNSTEESAQKAVAGKYDANNEVIQLNAIFAGSNATMAIELVNAETGIAIANATFKGKVLTVGGITIVQAIVTVDTEILEFADSVIAKVYADGTEIGSFAVKVKEA